MTLTVITPPDEEAVTLQAAKSYLRIGHDGEDAFVASLIESAAGVVEEALGQSLISRTLRQTWGDWPRPLLWQGRLQLRPGPVRTLVAVRLFDEAGAETKLADRFQLDDGHLKGLPGTWLPHVPQGGQVEIEFVSGFGAAGDVPAELQLAVLMVVEAAYSRRGDTRPALPESAASIIAAHREVRL